MARFLHYVEQQIIGGVLYEEQENGFEGVNPYRYLRVMCPNALFIW
jgi:hypothetical protein